MRLSHCLFRFLFSFVILASVAACGGDSPTQPEPMPGTIRVTTTVSGSDLDADGFLVWLNGGSRRANSPDDTTEESE